MNLNSCCIILDVDINPINICIMSVVIRISGDPVSLFHHLGLGFWSFLENLMSVCLRFRV